MVFVPSTKKKKASKSSENIALMSRVVFSLGVKVLFQPFICEPSYVTVFVPRCIVFTTSFYISDCGKMVYHVFKVICLD